LDAIFYYAEQSAKQDNRVPSNNEFRPFSLICTIGKVPGQIPHLDIVIPNYQFTLMVTTGTPGTIVYLFDNALHEHIVDQRSPLLGLMVELSTETDTSRQEQLMNDFVHNFACDRKEKLTTQNTK
jgi:hypothetical protein